MPTLTLTLTLALNPPTFLIRYETFLEKVQLLAPLSKDQRNKMVDALEEVSYASGQSIIKEGDDGHYFYIIVEGEVSITKAGQVCVPRRVALHPPPLHPSTLSHPHAPPRRASSRGVSRGTTSASCRSRRARPQSPPSPPPPRPPSWCVWTAAPSRGC